MKFFRLVSNFDNYGYYIKDEIYPEDCAPNGALSLEDCFKYNPNDWEEVSEFKFGRNYEMYKHK